MADAGIPEHTTAFGQDLLERPDSSLFAPEDARRLAAVRVGLFGLLAIRLATTDYRVATGQPAPFYQPVSYMRLFARMPSQPVAAGLRVCAIAAALMAAAGLAVRASMPVAVVCSLVVEGMLNSLGRVIVGDAVLLLCLLVVLASGRAAAEAWTLRGPLRRVLDAVRGSPPPPAAATAISPAIRHGWPVRTAMLTVTLGLFFAGLQKLRYSGFAWVTSDNMRWILYAASDSHSHPRAVALLIADRPWLAHLSAAGSLLLEIAFPLVLLAPRVRWPLIAAVVAMHEAIRLAIGLDYSAQWMTMLIVFIDWPVAVARLGEAFTWGRPGPPVRRQ